MHTHTRAPAAPTEVVRVVAPPLARRPRPRRELRRDALPPLYRRPVRRHHARVERQQGRDARRCRQRQAQRGALQQEPPPRWPAAATAAAAAARRGRCRRATGAGPGAWTGARGAGAGRALGGCIVPRAGAACAAPFPVIEAGGPALVRHPLRQAHWSCPPPCAGALRPPTCARPCPRAPLPAPRALPRRTPRRRHRPRTRAPRAARAAAAGRPRATALRWRTPAAGRRHGSWRGPRSCRSWRAVDGVGTGPSAARPGVGRGWRGAAWGLGVGPARMRRARGAARGGNTCLLHTHLCTPWATWRRKACPRPPAARPLQARPPPAPAPSPRRRRGAPHHGQWWSIRSTQRPHTRQWCARGGLNAAHFWQ